MVNFSYTLTTLFYLYKHIVNISYHSVLVECIMQDNKLFSDNVPTTETSHQDYQTLPIVKPVKVQAELAEVKENREFSGHYFFPEEEVESTSEATDMYYDNTNIVRSDVEMEIEHLKMSSITKDFLDEIFESDTSTESTSTVNTLSPDNINLYKSGYRFMKKFLEREKLVTVY